LLSLHVGQGRTSSRSDTDSDGGRLADTGADTDNLLGHPVTVQQEYVYCTEPPAALPPRVIAGQVSSSVIHGPSAQPTRIAAQSRSLVRAFAVVVYITLQNSSTCMVSPQVH